MPAFRNASFERLIEGTLKRSSAALRDAGIPYCLMGSLAGWVRGAGESSHDLDYGVRLTDVPAAAEALRRAGFEIEIPPEEWLIKAWDGPPGEEESSLVDLIYAPAGMPITDAVLQRTEVMHVLAQSMPVISATDLMVMKLSSLREQNLDYSPAMQTARAIREQVRWPEVRERTRRSPYACAFFRMAELLGVVPSEDGGAEPVNVLAEMQSDERRITPEYLRMRERLAEALAGAGDVSRNGDAGYAPAARSAQTTA